MWLRCLLLASLIAGCASPDTGLSADEARWCDATDPSVMLDAALELGFSRQEILLVLDDVDQVGPSIGRQDGRWIRVCRHAHSRRGVPGGMRSRVVRRSS